MKKLLKFGVASKSTPKKQKPKVSIKLSPKQKAAIRSKKGFIV